MDIEISIDHWLLQLVAPKLSVKYDSRKKRIVWYEGLSNIPGMKSVVITYQY